MNIDKAQTLVNQLGAELGGDANSYVMNDQGEVDLVFEDNLPVQIRFFEPTLIISSILASDLPAEDPGLFATLMDYQFMGIRTFGCVLAWNSEADNLVLSRMLNPDIDSAALAEELSLLLRATREVQEDLQPLLAGDYRLEEEMPEEQPPADFIPTPFDRA
jgi:hypothetical protein